MLKCAKKPVDILKVIESVLICELAGIIGAIFTVGAIPTWYATLVKPSFNPPNWIFSPVWNMLFLLMGLSLYYVWTSKSKKKIIAMKIFFVQLTLNALWSVLFFGLHSPILGLVDIIFLWVAIFFTIIYFKKVSSTSAFLLLPYILWVSFALVLNFSIVILN
jgi:tryptophan-rich sensory protein